MASRLASNFSERPGPEWSCFVGLGRGKLALLSGFF
jgi:hypothetical protein